jgi:hypothetical protein
MVETLFTSALFSGAILPFVLIFVLVFAILEKAKILGTDKHNINALIALAIGLIFISVGYAVDLVNQIVPIVGVALAAILIFLLIWGSVSKHDTPLDVGDNVRKAFMWIAFAVVGIALIYYTGFWAYLRTNYISGNFSDWIPTILLIVIVIVAVRAVLSGSSSGSEAKK